jgi:hypothetical protein
VVLEFKPKIIGDIGRWTLFPGTFIIGNAGLDRYIRVPAESVEPVWRSILYLDGSRTLDEINRQVLADGWNLDVAGLYQKLAGAGLVEGSTYFSDLDHLSVTWLEPGISGLFPVWRGWQGLVRVLAVGMVLPIAAAAWLWLSAPVRPAVHWAGSELEFALSLMGCALVSILVHEAAHAAAACAEGLRPERVRFLGYLGIIPYIMLRIPGLYTIRPASRLRIWAAGPLASLSLASFCYVGSAFQTLPPGARVCLDRMSILNAMIAAWNCCPLLPTDGYFIACTLLKQANWRLRSWREMAACFRQRRRPQALLLLYGVGSCIAVLLMTLHSIGKILSAASFSWFGYAAVLLLILMFGFKRAALKRQKLAARIGGM